MCEFQLRKHTVFTGLVILVVAGFAMSTGVAVFATPPSPPQAACGDALELPEGASVQRDGSRLLIRVPSGYVLSNDSVQPRFVTADPDTVVPAGEEGAGLLSEVDCSCSGSGGCTETFDGTYVFCDAFDGCTNCVMDIQFE